MTYLGRGKSTIISFTITKEIDYLNDDLAIEAENNLVKLSKAKFKDVHIPNFSFKRNSNTLTYTCDYVKGRELTFVEMRSIVYECCVLHNDSFSLTNYSRENYIKCDDTGLIYYIDLNDCGVISIEDRKKIFIEKNGSLAI